MENMEAVLEVIIEALKHPHPNPLPGRARAKTFGGRLSSKRTT
jgi:hypothetical protein